jgi:hypothetical protein
MVVRYPWLAHIDLMVSWLKTRVSAASSGGQWFCGNFEKPHFTFGVELEYIDASLD